MEILKKSVNNTSFPGICLYLYLGSVQIVNEEDRLSGCCLRRSLESFSLSLGTRGGVEDVNCHGE